MTPFECASSISACREALMHSLVWMHRAVDDLLRGHAEDSRLGHRSGMFPEIGL